nr:phosphoglucosamine mutase [FCB group bacterium]
GIDTNVVAGVAATPAGGSLAGLHETAARGGNDNTFSEVVDFVLRHKKGPITANVSTTRTLDDLARKYEVELHRSKVGEVHVAKKMAAVGAVIGGEGNGGVILPEVHLGRDAPVGAALILQYMTEMEKPLSEIVADLPHYQIVKDKISIEGLDKDEIFARIEANAREAQIDKTDGIKLIHPRSWVQVRASNTEPILRIFAEASNSVDAQRMVDDIRKIVTGNDSGEE